MPTLRNKTEKLSINDEEEALFMRMQLQKCLTRPETMMENIVIITL
jgi:hypothetical protein